MLRCFVVLFALLAISVPAAAQSPTSLAAALEAQYRAAIVRERRLADERELTLVADAETRMRTARDALTRASVDRAAAERTLEAARADYIRLVGSIALQDSVTQIEVEAFRAEVEGRLPEATPELLEAYRQFADGDRAGAWAELDVLLRARAAARTASARAVAAGEIRQLASLRDVMRVNGEARIADVIALWTQAAELDPQQFRPHLQIASLASQLGDFPRSRRHAERAHALADSDARRAWAAVSLALVTLNEGDQEAAGVLIRQAVESARREHAARPSLDSRDALARLIMAEGMVRAARAEFEASFSAYDEALAIARLAAAEDQGRRLLLATVLASRARARLAHGDFDQAEAEIREASNVANEAIRANPQALDAKIAFSDVVTTMSAVAMSKNGLYAATVGHEIAVSVRRQMVEFDPDDTTTRRSLVGSYAALGAMFLELRDNDRARVNYDLAIEHARALIAVEPDSYSFKATLAGALAARSDLDVRMRDLSAARTLREQALQMHREIVAGSASLATQRELVRATSSLADVRADLGERDAARSMWRQAVADGQALLLRSPRDRDTRHVVFTSMQRLAVYFPDGEIGWAEVVAYLEDMERQGMLSALMRGWLDDARNQLAARRR